MLWKQDEVVKALWRCEAGDVRLTMWPDAPSGVEVLAEANGQKLWSFAADTRHDAEREAQRLLGIASHAKR
jgi:hypothetical protein